mgnify:CR=1 FL=1
MEYQTAWSLSPKQLDEEVNRKLQRGWQLYGNPYVIHKTQSQDEYVRYCQALVKVSSDDE